GPPFHDGPSRFAPAQARGRQRTRGRLRRPRRAPAFNWIRLSSRIAMRCTTPMKALRPPPTMPTRNRPPLSPSTAVAWTIGLAFDAEQLEIGRAVSAGLGE